MKYWLLKSEPSAFSIEDLAQQENETSHWDGVRNYQARNFMREMKTGDLAFFYHSNCKEIGIAGIVEITRESYPDHTAFDPEDHHFDPKSDPENPRWFMVDVTLKEKFNRILTLADLKKIPALEEMMILRKGNRLSVTPLITTEWEIICNHATKNAHR